MKKVICSANAPAAIGPYSQAIQTKKTLYTSGQIGLDPKSGVLAEGLKAQAYQALSNLMEVLREAGMKSEDVVKTTVFLTDMENFAAVNGIYEQYFKAPYPARSCVAVAALPKGALVEIECIARKEQTHESDR